MHAFGTVFVEVHVVGAYGIGHASAAAIANAIWHATGRRLRDLPFTPD